jgi:hypothetical protein
MDGQAWVDKDGKAWVQWQVLINVSDKFVNAGFDIDEKVLKAAIAKCLPLAKEDEITVSVLVDDDAEGTLSCGGTFRKCKACGGKRGNDACPDCKGTGGYIE